MSAQQSKPQIEVVSSLPKETRLAERRTPELVLGFVGPVGSGVTTTSEIFSDRLKDEYGYDVSYLKVSEIIRECAKFVGEELDGGLTGTDRITQLQTTGNNLRNKFGSDYLCQKVIEKIATARLEYGYDTTTEPFAPTVKRYAHIIDSVKNPAEVELLRGVYGEVFWLVGVFAPEEVRKARMKKSGVPETDLQTIINRDEDEDFGHGQRVRDTILDADFFVRNDGENDERLAHSVDRFLDVLFDVSVNTPTTDETAMFEAVSSAARSACLSRQVGAAIYSAKGELIGVGANDVPRFAGGLYGIEDVSNDHRCYKWGGKICHNDERKEKLYDKILMQLVKEGIIANKEPKKKAARKVLATSDIRNLIEYSRSVHAEMEAIISVARGEKSGLVGATMYSTTFPCHSCARHIVASGIRRVVYVEPYTKSLATELHNDSISIKEGDAEKKVVFLQYDGVAPKNILKLFKHGHDRKNSGRLISKLRKEAVPVFQPPIDGFATREQIVMKKLSELEKGSTEGNESVQE